MIRAVFFDFYSVWAPDTIGTLLKDAKTSNPEELAGLETMVDHYFHGGVGTEMLADSFRWRLGRRDVSQESFVLAETPALSTVVDFIRRLHGHFLKVALVANLGVSDLDFVTNVNNKYALFEVIVSPLSLGSSQQLLSKEVFGNAVNAIGESPPDCLAVSGHTDYLKFAASLGMQTIKFTHMDSLSKSLEKLLAQDTPTAVSHSQPYPPTGPSVYPHP